MDQSGRPVDDELVGLFDLSHDAFCIAGFDGYLTRAIRRLRGASDTPLTSYWPGRSWTTSTPMMSSRWRRC
jgi:hypothetical protein